MEHVKRQRNNNANKTWRIEGGIESEQRIECFNCVRKQNQQTTNQQRVNNGNVQQILTR